MSLETKIEQRQTQQLILTPQMKLAIYLLHLPLMELNTYLKEQIVENPLIEQTEEDFYKKELDKDKEKDEVDKFIDLSEQKIEVFGDQQYNRDEEKRRRYKESIATRDPTLDEHLMRRLNIFSQSALEKTIGEAVIGNINKNGYLETPVEEIAQNLNASHQDVEKTLSLIQSFSPIGVGARNLSECLLLQLKQKGKGFSLAAKIVKMYLPDLEKRRFKRIAKRLGVSIDEVKSAFLEISSLEPKPGHSFGNERPRYITPDILLYSSGNGYKIEINNEDMPVLRISSYYRKLLRDKNTPEETKEFLKKKLNQALWLVKAIERRHDTIRKVVECIIKIQKDFLVKGPGFIKPLTLKDVAQIIGVNESTVSRAVANKYIYTPYGIFGLKCFFNGKVRQDKGSALSIENVKARIKGLVDNENLCRTLSDEAIVKIFHSEGINIARRTVTKYRKLLNIPSSNLRKG